MADDNPTRPAKRQKVDRETDQPEDEAKGVNWADLSAAAIRLVTIFAGTSGIHFCATCKAFRDAQPPLRGLIIDQEVGVSDLTWRDDDKEKLKDEFCVSVKSDIGSFKQPHKFIESLPDRYANEITHLYIEAIHGYDEENRVLSTLLNGPVEEYGKNLISLCSLHLRHPPSTPYSSTERLPISLRDCALQLVRATKATLRDLFVQVRIRFDVNDAVTMFEEIGLEKLHHLTLDLIPLPSRLFFIPQGNEADTIRLKQLAEEKCTSLQGNAAIVCHQTNTRKVVYLGSNGGISREEEFTL